MFSIAKFHLLYTVDLYCCFTTLHPHLSSDSWTMWMFPFDFSILRGGKVLSCHMHLTAHEITPTEKGMKICCLTCSNLGGRGSGDLTLQVIRSSGKKNSIWFSITWAFVLRGSHIPFHLFTQKCGQLQLNGDQFLKRPTLYSPFQLKKLKSTPAMAIWFWLPTLYALFFSTNPHIPISESSWVEMISTNPIL